MRALYDSQLSFESSNPDQRTWNVQVDRPRIDSTMNSCSLWIYADRIVAKVMNTLGKLVTEKPVDFVGFDNVVEFNKNRQNDDNVVKAYKS